MYLKHFKGNNENVIHNHSFDTAQLLDITDEDYSENNEDIKIIIC